MRRSSGSPAAMGDLGSHRRSRRSQRGFSLLEAVVALAVFAGVGMSLYALLDSSLLGLNRAKDAAHQEAAVHRAFEYLGAINPRRRPQGQADVGGDYLVRWNSTLLEPVRQSQGTQGGKGLYEVGLYAVDIDLIKNEDSREREVGRYRLRLVGFEKVRSLDN
ncbi:PulJ/GspJ family protein [Thioalkalivibrio sp. HK1]|uniref:PulJ/GspJ family protein n=1 Tax=Thioalkalivibrio sp. HK1 TaxID=1469245 RepID=UPI00046F94C6|nr:prepilin-type N-terminal cleavage/methylation domain-containing protein [Thioalkalivibrio sp. HK1]